MFKLTARAIILASLATCMTFIPAVAQNGSSGHQADSTGTNPWDKYAPPEKVNVGARAEKSGKTPNSRTVDPWDKYAPPAKNTTGEPATSATTPSPAPSEATGSNPWDKYAPLTKVTAGSATSNTAPSEVTGSDPWDKYVTDKVPMVPFAPNTPEQQAEPVGSNPWDKYQPAAMPKATSKKATIKQPQQLELADPLTQLPVPTQTPTAELKLPVGRDYHYAIDYHGHLVGYSEFLISNELTLDGQATYIMTSSSRIKLGTTTPKDMRYFSKLMVNKRDLSPASLITTQKSEQNDYRITCIYSPGLVAQSNIYVGRSNNYVHELESNNAHLVFNNLWGQMDTFAEHYWFLVLSAKKGGVVKVYDPILRTDGEVTVYPPVPEKWANAGINYNSLLYTISDLYGSPLAKVRLNAANKELLEISEIGTGVHFKLSTPGVVKQVDKAVGLDIWPSKVHLSNIYFSDVDKLTHMEADLELSLRGGQLAQHSITGYDQKMYGKVKEGSIKGRVVVDSKPSDITPSAGFPFNVTVPEDIQPYLYLNRRAESHDSSILNKAKEITWRAEDSFQAVHRMTDYIANKIENGISLPSSRQTLEHGVGNPESKALLLVDMCRSLNIPARCIGGLVYQRGEFAPHYWAEVWLGPDVNWMAFDPSTSESGFINATHIALWNSGDVQALNIEVDKFAPHPVRQVPFFNKKLAWPVGEKRTYAIVSNGQRIGTETAHLRDLELIDNHEAYNFHAETAMFANGMPWEEPTAKSEGEVVAPTVDDTTAPSAPSTETVTATDVALTPAGESADAPLPHAVTVTADTASATAIPQASSVTSSEPEVAGSGSQADVSVVVAPNANSEAENSEAVEATPVQVLSLEEREAKLAAEAVIEHTDCSDTLYNSVGLPMRTLIKLGNGDKSENSLRFSNNRVYQELTVGEQKVQREVPVSNGLYLGNQRFLSQWALAVEQIPLDEEQEGQEAGTYSIHVFVPDMLDVQELLLMEDEEVSTVVMPDGQEVNATCLRSEKGMEFYLDENHKVVKIAIPNLDITVYLLKREFSLE